MKLSTTQFHSQVTPLNLLNADETNSLKLTDKAIWHILNDNCGNSLQNLRQAHALIIKTGHFKDSYVAGTIVKFYASSNIGKLDVAVGVLGQVPKPNAFLWNFMIKGCLDNSEPYAAIEFYTRMVVSDSRPNKYTYPSVFKSCMVLGAAKEGVQVHAHVVKHGLGGDGHIKSSGVQMYSSFGQVKEARRMLSEDEKSSDVVCWNAMLDGYFKCGEVGAARDLFELMVDRSVGTWNAMIRGFARCGMIESARDYFSAMPLKDEISWSAMIDGYVKGGHFKEALEIFQQLQREEVRPTKFVLPSVLTVCANLGALDQGRWIHFFVKKNSIKVDAVIGTSLVDMYAKCGRLDMAWEVFENMKHREVDSWNAMIGGLAVHGRAEDAIELFSKMQMAKLNPDAITFVSLLTACAHAGLVDTGLELLHSMKEDYGIEPKVEHYGCVVDLLGRAGLLSTAEELMSSMPMKPNAAVWGALLGACRVQGNLELGERIGKLLLELEPQNSGRYALLSNIYAKAGKWDNVEEVRQLMKERGLKTNPGISVIDLDGIVHEFRIGDGSHPRKEEIYATLERIIERIKSEGYSPDTSQVLFDIEEEEKETAVKHHSEKLAIALGILSTPPGSTIRVMKNLRVCEDCHSATKFISKVYSREIVVRDRVRFHHFKNGICSCKDYW